jgi:sulfur carrier protein ThiS adenylyltransferase
MKKLEDFFGKKKFRRISRTRIGIAGCGGLGSNCASFLVRSGFRYLKLVDFDKIEYSNLNRQFFFYEQKGEKKTEALKKNLEKINPSVKITIETKQIVPNNIKNIFKEYPVIVEAFDAPEYKSMIVSELSGEKELIVSASGVCGIGASDNIVTRRISGNVVIVGDFVTDTQKAFPFAPRVSIAAAKQADVILEYILSK